MTRVEQDKLKWRCRRGLLELDLVFHRFLPTLKDEEAMPFAALLELHDNHLWDVVAGRSEDYAPHLSAIVARLRAA